MRGLVCASGIYTLYCEFPVLSNDSCKCILQMSLQAELRFSLLKEAEDELGSVELGD